MAISSNNGKGIYEQNQDELDFIRFPWATVLDKRFSGQQVFDCLEGYLAKKRGIIPAVTHKL